MADTKIGQSALDAQLAYIRDNSTWIRLVKNYTRADTFATVDTNTIAKFAYTGGTIFGTITDNTSAPGDANAPNRRLPVNAQLLDNATGTNILDNPLSLVITDASEILANTDETTDRAVAVDDAITTFAWWIQASQPTQE
jgi:hypothetical protein